MWKHWKPFNVPHQGAELLPTHGPSPSRSSCLLRLNVLFSGNLGWRHREPFLFAISWTCSGYWVTRVHMFVSAGYQATVHWRKWKSRPTSKNDPRFIYRLRGKCPLYRYETTGQLLHSEIGSNHVGCSLTWQRSPPPKKFQHLTIAEEVVITRLRIRHTKATKSHILSRGPPTVCHHCGQTLTIDHVCSWNVQCYGNVVMNTTQLTRWKLSSRQFLRLA